MPLIADAKTEVRIACDQATKAEFTKLIGEVQSMVGEKVSPARALRSVMKVWRDTPAQIRAKSLVEAPGTLHARVA